MTLDASEQTHIREYLLGSMPHEDLSPLEERLLTDPEFYQELSILEEDLIDAYVSGSLSQNDQGRFEKHFLLSPERHRKLRFAHALKKYVDASKEAPATSKAIEPRAAEFRATRKRFLRWDATRSPVLRYSLAAAAVIVIAIGSLGLFRYWKSHDADQNTSVATAVLITGQTREGGQTNRVSLPKGTNAVRLDLLLTGSEYSRYDAVLLRDNGAEIWKEQNLQAVNKDGMRFIQLNIPAQVFDSEDYQIKVVGTHSDGSSEPLSSYRFRVLR